MTDLTLETTGRFEVTTGSGTAYILDLDEKTATRYPHAATPVDETVSSDLRKDGETVTLIKVLSGVLGSPLTLLLSAVDNYAGYTNTTRYATRVMSIAKIS